jgi:hypothetical protein
MELIPELINKYDIFKLLRSPGIGSKESIPQRYIGWRAGTPAQEL